MSNRTLAFLLLVWIIWTFVLLYLYYFVYYTSKISFHSNIWDYDVKLNASDMLKEFSYKCDQKDCDLKSIAPLEYKLSITKEGYKTIYKNASLTPRSKKDFDIVFEKNTALEKVLEEEEVQETKAEKIDRIREKKKYHSYFYFWNDSKYYFKEEWSKMKLFTSIESKEVFLWSFHLEEKESIELKEIHNSRFIYVKVWDKRFVLNLDSLNKKELQLKTEIIYLKWWKSEKDILLVTENWTYTYNFQNNKLEYFYLFKDFVFLKDWYIWIINKNEKKKLINYWLKAKTENLIIKYNPINKDRKIIFETNFKVEKIIKQWDDVYVITKEGKYKLDNY